MTRLLLASSLVVGLAATTYAQDPAKVYPKQYHVVLDNAKVRVLHVMLGPGEKNDMHEHPDHAVVVLSDSDVRFTMPDGKTSDVAMKAGEAMYVGAGKHAGANTGKAKLEAIIVELKGNAAPTAQLPASRPGIASKELLDNPRVRVIRAMADPTFAEPAGTKHDYDQVVIPLAPATLSLTVDGKTVTSWKPGDAQYIGRGTAHESKNTSGKNVDFVIVAIK